MRSRILTLVAAVATAGLLMAWGCGGKAVMGAGEGILDNGSVPFVATTSGGTSAPEALGLTKDIDTSGSGAPLGQVNSEGESADVMCEFQWDTATNDGGGIVTPVITIDAEYTPDEMKAICVAEATCGPGGDEPCGYSPLNCIGCINEYLWTDDPLVEPIVYETRDATLYCAGNVPNHYTSDLKYIKARLICHPLLSAGDVDLDHTWVIETGESKFPWPEINTAANLLGVDIIDGILDNNPALGSFFDLTYNTGNPAHPTLVTAPLHAGSAVDDYDPMASSRKWKLFLDITTRGTDTPVVFDFDRTIETELSLAGVTSSTAMLQRSRLYLAWGLCDNDEIGCAPITSWKSLAMVGGIKSAATKTPISDGSTDVDVSGDSVELDGVGGASFYSGSIGAYDMMSGYTKVFFSPVTMLTGEATLMPYAIVADSSPLDASVFIPIGLMKKGGGAEALGYKYALRPLTLTFNAGVLGDIAGSKFSTDAPYSITFTPMGQISEYWDVNTLELNGGVQKYPDVWQVLTFTNDPIWANMQGQYGYGTIEAAILDGAITFVEDNVLYPANKLAYDSAAGFPDAKYYVVRMDKHNISGEETGSSISAKFYPEAGGFTVDGTRVVMALRQESDATKALMFGLMGRKDLTIMDVDFSAEMQAGQTFSASFDNGKESITPVAFDTDWTTTKAAIEDALEALNIVATATFVGNLKLRIASSGPEFAYGTFTISVDNGGPNLSYSPAGPARMECYAEPVNNDRVLDHGCRGATAVTLSIVWGEDPNKQTQIKAYYQLPMQMPVAYATFDPVTFVGDKSFSLIFTGLDDDTKLSLDDIELIGLDGEGLMSGPPIGEEFKGGGQTIPIP